DREEIHNLSGRMDDVIDHIEAAADALLLYKVTKPTPTAVELAQLIYASTREISLAVPLLRDNKDLRKINQHAIEINRLENDADRVFRAGMAALLEQDDLFELFRWKAIYDLLEEATDCCEDVADVLQGIVMRNL